ncbi:MAG: RNA ligase [Archaeoglobus sp.]|nr:MAG: RNA ligase [Archaeoglobus sp.]
MKFVAEALSLSEPAAKRLHRRGILKSAFIPHPFFSDIDEAYLLEKKFGKYEEGTFIASSHNRSYIARGFPKIKRTLVLEECIKKHFKGCDVAVEEKINGYNVRILKIGENIYAVTRRGYICPYTTERARELINKEFFNDFPDYMLCCEAAGLESPHVQKEIYGKRLEFYLFDIRNTRTNEALSVEKKIKIAEEYNLRLAEVFGFWCCEELLSNVIKIIKRLNREGREGIVMKDINMKRLSVKYTTSYCNCSDLNYAFRYFNDIGRDFMLTRAVREGFQSYEIDSEETRKERYLRIGKAIVDGILSSIDNVIEEGKLYERSKLRFRNKEVMELFIKHMKKLARVNFEYLGLDNEGYHVLFMEKQVISTADRIKNLISGGFW